MISKFEGAGERTDTLRYRDIFALWWPLFLSWIIMSMEMPLIQAFISRLPHAELCLAAIGMVYAVCLTCEAPIIMLVSTGAALVKDAISLQRLQRFSQALSGFMSIVYLIILVMMEHAGLLLRWANYDAMLSERVYYAGLLTVPVPFLVGNRRFFQGVLIAGGQGRRVTVGAITRVSIIFITGLLLSLCTPLNGALVGAAASLSGILAESVLITFLSKPFRMKLSTQVAAEELTYRQIAQFYLPLALSGLLNLAVLPSLTFLMSRAPDPLRSIASYQILQAMFFSLGAAGLAMQEVIVSRIGARHEQFQPLRNAALLICVLQAVLFATFVFSPVQSFWLGRILEIPEDLRRFMHPALVLSVCIIPLTVIVVSVRAVILAARRTRWVTIGSIVEIAAIVTSVEVARKLTDLPGLQLAIIALLIARLAVLAVTIPVFVDIRRQFFKPGAAARGD